MSANKQPSRSRSGNLRRAANKAATKSAKPTKWPTKVEVQIGINPSGEFYYIINGVKSATGGGDAGNIDVSKDGGKGLVVFSADPQSVVPLLAFAVTIDPLKVKGTKLDSLGFAVGKKTITFKIPSKAQNDDEYTYSVVAFAANATYSVDPKLRIYN